MMPFGWGGEAGSMLPTVAKRVENIRRCRLQRRLLSVGAIEVGSEEKFEAPAYKNARGFYCTITPGGLFEV